MPAWRRGSPWHTGRVREAARLRALIERVRLHRRWVVPDGRGSLSRYRIDIPRPAEPA
jgi:hypothetical protein